MHIKKRVLAQLPKVYSIAKIPCSNPEGGPSFVAGSEVEGPLLCFEPPDYTPKVVAEQPGGFISLWPFEKGGHKFLIASTQFWPGFDAAECEISIYSMDHISNSKPVKSFPLPYTHRVAVVELGGELVFVASTLCSQKNTKEDWTHPGGIFTARIPESIHDDWVFSPALDGLNKNHGMDMAQIESRGNKGFLVSAMQGCFFLGFPSTPDAPWSVTRIDAEETSDAYAFDWDGSGEPQVFSIQPFHGNQVCVFRNQNGEWRKSILTEEIEFGHVLWAGPLLGRRALIVGWRRGTRDLVVYWKTGPGENDYEKEVIDHDIGPAQMAVHHAEGRDYLMVSGHGVESVLLYELSE